MEREKEGGWALLLRCVVYVASGRYGINIVVVVVSSSCIKVDLRGEGRGGRRRGEEGEEGGGE